jgi:hypothetical protein
VTALSSASLSVVARHFAFVRETLGPNRGHWVAFFQRFCRGQEGESWCADFVSVVLDVAYMGKPPLAPTGSTKAMLSQATVKGYGVTVPRVDDLYFFVRADSTPHHVGIVTDTFPLSGIAGNTSEDGLSSDGVGVFEHAISSGPRTVFVRLP